MSADGEPFPNRRHEQHETDGGYSCVSDLHRLAHDDRNEHSNNKQQTTRKMQAASAESHCVPVNGNANHRTENNIVSRDRRQKSALLKDYELNPITVHRRENSLARVNWMSEAKFITIKKAHRKPRNHLADNSKKRAR